MTGIVASIAMIAAVLITAFGSSSISTLFALVLGFVISTTVLSYLFIFPSYLLLRFKYPNVRRPYKVPGGMVGAWIVVLLALGYAALASFFILWPRDATVATDGVTRFTYEMTQFIPLAIIVLLTTVFYIWGHTEKTNQDVVVDYSQQPHPGWGQNRPQQQNASGQIGSQGRGQQADGWNANAAQQEKVESTPQHPPGTSTRSSKNAAQQEKVESTPPSIHFYEPTLSIFISHSARDDDFGRKLVQDLRKAFGSDEAVWYDSEGGLYGGDSWWSRIVTALGKCDVFVIVLSPNSTNSKWVMKELDIATVEGKRVVPILYRQCDIRSDLKAIQIISFLEPIPYGAAFNKLLQALKH